MFERAGMRSLIAAPLMSRSRVMGVMELADPRPGRFSTDDMELLVSVGNAIGVAVENAYLCNNIRYYAQQVTRAQEDERPRIARELHDDTIQALIVLARQIEALALRNEENPPVETRALRELKTAVDDILQGVRRFSRDLRPSTLDDLGLLPTLEGLAASLTEKDSIPTRLYVTGERRRLAPETELVLFRIVQEALNNVKKHAGATQATVTVKFADDMVEMTVQDNGKGFTLNVSVEELAVSGHLGLIGMRERARLVGGDLSIQTQPGRGAKVTVKVPSHFTPRLL
ncbi:MAG: ATP-binding protein [Anaerolineae bacterium]